MPNLTYRWGFVGAGWMAKAMAGDLQLLDRAQVAGVVAATEASARAFALKFGARAYPSLDAMLADPAIDIVHVTTPNHLHHPHAKLALQAGKAVLCEKPFTLNAAQAEDLIAAARANQAFLMEAMWVRFLPLQVKLRRLLAEGAIGDLRLMRASFHSQAPFDPDNRFYNPAMGGGTLLDLGIYPISMMAMLFGARPRAIESHAYLGPTGVDEHFAAIFAFDQGSMATISGGIDGHFDEDIDLFGDQGSIRTLLGEGGWKQSRMQVTDRRGKTQALHLPYLGKGYAHQALEVQRCLDARELESPTLPLDESLAIMRLLDTLRAQWGLKFPGE